MVFSWQMAEELAAAHMRSIGFEDARRTPAGTDGGIDVIASRAVAQVKYQSAPVGGPVVQQLRGAAHGYEHALFYSFAGYTQAALTAAAAANVALFTFTETNDVVAVNLVASALDRADPPWRTRFADLMTRVGVSVETITLWSKIYRDVMTRLDEPRREMEELTASGRKPSDAHRRAVDKAEDAALDLRPLSSAFDAVYAALEVVTNAQEAFVTSADAGEYDDLDGILDSLEKGAGQVEAAVAGLPEAKAAVSGRGASYLAEAYGRVTKPVAGRA